MEDRELRLRPLSETVSSGQAVAIEGRGGMFVLTFADGSTRTEAELKFAVPVWRGDD